MGAIAFDTLKFARKLEKAGFTPEQAVGAAEAFGAALGDELVSPDHLVTKSDLEEALEPIKADIAELKADGIDIKMSLAVVKAELTMIKWVAGGIGFGVAMLILKSFWPG